MGRYGDGVAVRVRLRASSCRRLRRDVLERADAALEVPLRVGRDEPRGGRAVGGGRGVARLPVPAMRRLQQRGGRRVDAGGADRERSRGRSCRRAGRRTRHAGPARRSGRTPPGRAPTRRAPSRAAGRSRGCCASACSPRARARSPPTSSRYCCGGRLGLVEPVGGLDHRVAPRCSGRSARRCRRRTSRATPPAARCRGLRPWYSRTSATMNGSSRAPKREEVRRTPFATARSLPCVRLSIVTMRSASPSLWVRRITTSSR